MPSNRSKSVSAEMISPVPSRCISAARTRSRALMQRLVVRQFRRQSNVFSMNGFDPTAHGIGESPDNLAAQGPEPRRKVAMHQFLEHLRVSYE